MARAVVSLRSQALRVEKLLRAHGLRLVLAESCTGGRVAASLSEIPGISNFFCGSFVTYRDDSKKRWLGVRASALRYPGAVSAAVARAMAKGALQKTPEATIAAAVTGYLGPDPHKKANPKDGLVFFAVAMRSGAILERSTRLARAPRGKNPAQHRVTRARIASHSLLTMVRSLLESTAGESR